MTTKLSASLNNQSEKHLFIERSWWWYLLRKEGSWKLPRWTDLYIFNRKINGRYESIAYGPFEYPKKWFICGLHFHLEISLDPSKNPGYPRLIRKKKDTWQNETSSTQNHSRLSIEPCTKTKPKAGNIKYKSFYIGPSVLASGLESHYLRFDVGSLHNMRFLSLNAKYF